MARYIITDIHGCVKTFRELLYHGIKINKNDTLYFLGDYTDKGPDSKGVLDELLKLREQNYNLSILRGNHDQMLPDTLAGFGLDSWKTDTEKQLTLQSFGVTDPRKVPRKYHDFILQMPYFYVLPQYYLVHAGFNFTAKRPLDDTYAMMNIKEYRVNKEILGGRNLIHGHNAVNLQKVKATIANANSRINLDAGCVYYKNAGEGMGNLVALNLDTMELTVQPNIDAPYDIERKK